MNAHILFDKFAYVDRLRNAGVDEALARAHGDGLEQALREEVATKSDVTELKADLKGVEVALRGEIKDLGVELRGEIKDLETKMEIGFANLKTEIAKSQSGNMKLILGQSAFFLALAVAIIHFMK